MPAASFAYYYTDYKIHNTFLPYAQEEEEVSGTGAILYLLHACAKSGLFFHII
jgi:hypothetical protein